MPKQEVRLYLLDQNGNSPNFGVDETITIEAENLGKLEKKIAQAKEDFAHFLVANEDFYWSETVGYQVGKNGIDYEIIAD
jgi:hypothetical protein